ncbi:hypothetical protein MHPYR_180084 [uncultured Mycobacterium sp.]|uniref:Uncharacterized protein n=1 Tax=uncultured Mycobacterium sp. TaxID=171292 RepID=A0A1Y5P5A8_9MYCO|nr:hypothetical protein MHPYR_180084 [uncultured Mycobacterium sp.]
MSEFNWRITSLNVWTVVKADAAGRVTVWLKPGWYLRSKNADGVISFTPIDRWRLWRHRILWGFGHGLVDAR